jgi:hypothetical protein
LIPSLAITLFWATVAVAQDEPGAPDPGAPEGDGSPASDGDDDGGEEDGDPLSPHRTNLDVLSERTIGSASRPVRFNWRRSHAHVAVTGGFLFELNNFNSGRVGAVGRFPSGGLIFEVGLAYAAVGDTRSSEQLALTPYRQPGRPPRMEIDAGVVVPLAEGIVTANAKFVPALQLVFTGYVGLRYNLYPTGWGGMTVRQVAGAIFSPSLTDIEIDNLDDARLDAMTVDRGRYGLMLGFGNDIYFKQGLFVTPRVTMGVPLLAPVSQTELLFTAELSLALGLAF